MHNNIAPTALNDTAAYCEWLRRSPIKALTASRQDRDLISLFGVHQRIARAIANMPTNADLCEVDILVMPGTQEAVLTAFSERSLYNIVRDLSGRVLSPYLRVVAATSQDVLSAFEIEGDWVQAEHPCLVQSITALADVPLVIVVGESVESWAYAGPWVEAVRTAVRMERPIRLAAANSAAEELFAHAMRLHGIENIAVQPQLIAQARQAELVHFQRVLAFVESEVDSVSGCADVARMLMPGFLHVLHECVLSLEDSRIYRQEPGSSTGVGREVSPPLPGYLRNPPRPDSALIERLTWGMSVFDWLEDSLRFTDQVLV